MNITLSLQENWQKLEETLYSLGLLIFSICDALYNLRLTIIRATAPMLLNSIMYIFGVVIISNVEEGGAIPRDPHNTNIYQHRIQKQKILILSG